MFQALMTMADESVRQLQHTQARLLGTPTPAPTPANAPGHAHVAMVPLKHLNAYQEVLGHMAARQMHICQGLLASAFKPVAAASIPMELVQMQQAIFQRLSAQQTQFLEDLAELAAGAGGMKKANTMSKLMEQEYDFFAQIHALLAGQATTLMELMESIQIGYGYLLTRKAEGDAP
jgi:hypothetical protein